MDPDSDREHCLPLCYPIQENHLPATQQEERLREKDGRQLLCWRGGGGGGVVALFNDNIKKSSSLLFFFNEEQVGINEMESLYACDTGKKWRCKTGSFWLPPPTKRKTQESQEFLRTVPNFQWVASGRSFKSLHMSKPNQQILFWLTERVPYTNK